MPQSPTLTRSLCKDVADCNLRVPGILVIPCPHAWTFTASILGIKEKHKKQKKKVKETRKKKGERNNTLL